jgi:hypothetical protein
MALSLIHTLYSSLWQALRLLSLPCLHWALPGNGSSAPCSAASVLAGAASLQTPLRCTPSDFRHYPRLTQLCSVTLLGNGFQRWTFLFLWADVLAGWRSSHGSLVPSAQTLNCHWLLYKASARTQWKTPPPMALISLHDVTAGAEHIKRHGRHRTHRLQRFLNCCVRIRCRGNVLTETFPSKGNFFQLWTSGFQAVCHNKAKYAAINWIWTFECKWLECSKQFGGHISKCALSSAYTSVNFIR